MSDAGNNSGDEKDQQLQEKKDELLTKRKVRDEDDDYSGGDGAKKLKSEQNDDEVIMPLMGSGTGTASDPFIISIAPDKVGHVIGSKGAVIHDMQNRTGAKIYVNQNLPPGVNRQVCITGTKQQIQTAIALVQKVLQAGPTAIHSNMISGGPMRETSVDCPQNLVGRVIGAGGATIKDIQQKSGAKIQVDQNFPDGVPRKVLISGTDAAVETAINLVRYIMENGPSSTPSVPSTPHYPGYSASPVSGYSAPMSMGQSTPLPNGLFLRVFDVPKAVVGRVIGKKGENVLAIGRKSGCKIQIEQNVPEGQPCKAQITGPPTGIPMAEQLIQEIIHSETQAKMGTPYGAPGMPPAVPGAPYYGGAPTPGMAMNPYPMATGAMPMNPYGYMMPNPAVNPAMPTASTAGRGYGAPAAAAPPASVGYPGYPHHPAQHPHHPAPYPSSMPGMSAGYSTGYPSAAPVAAPVAAPAPIPAAPSEPIWTEYKTDDGLSYWHNRLTQTTQVRCF